MSFSCPGCTEPMVLIRRPRMHVEACGHCHAAWFDAGELEQHLAQMVTLEAPGLDQEPKLPRSCPHCFESMEPANVPAAQNVLVERCPRHGVFVPGSAMEQLDRWARTQPLTRRAPRTHEAGGLVGPSIGHEKTEDDGKAWVWAEVIAAVLEGVFFLLD